MAVAPEHVLTLAAFLSLVVAGALTLLFSTRFEAWPRTLAWLNLGALGLSALCFALTLGSSGTLYGMITVGGLTSYAGVVLAIIAALTILGVMADPHKYEAGTGEIYALITYTALGGAVMVGANNLLLFYLGLELSAYSTYVLVGYYRDDAYSAEAAAKYFTLGALASALLLYGISLVYGASGSLFYEGILASLSLSLPPLLWPGLALLLVGFAFKLALVPFHAWTPDAYQGAPTMVAGLLSVGPKAAVSIALGGLMLRAFAVPEVMTALQGALIGLAVLTMTVGNLQALNQTNLKRLLGYSSVAQLGYVAVGLTAGTLAGVQAVMFYALAYAFANLGAFTAISVLRGAGVAEELDAYRGLGKRQPRVAFLLALFLLSLAGVPLLAGFAAKLFVFVGAVNAGLYLLVAVAVVNTLLAYVYYARVVVRMYVDSVADEVGEDDAGALSVPPRSLVALGVAAVGVVVLGVLPGLALGPAGVALEVMRAVVIVAVP